MSTTWPKLKMKLLLLLVVAAFLLGQCQAHAGASHEAGKVNNVTLTPPGLIVAQQQQQQEDEEQDQDQDQLTPHAAPSSQRKLSRGKRFVAFPQGSSASGAVCLTTGVIGNPNLLYLSLGINWGVAYDLPNVTWVLQNAHGWTTKKSAKAQIKRRHRRELYGRLETMIDSSPSAVEAGAASRVARATLLLAMIYAHFVLFNYRLIVAKFLIYGLIATTNATPSFTVADTPPPPHFPSNVSHDLWPPPTLMTMMERADDSTPSTAAASTTTATTTTTTTSTSLETSALSMPHHQRWLRLLSRKRRYLAFPEGSSFSVAVCFTVGIIGNPYYGYNSFGLNWGTAYDLPNTSWVLQHLHGFATHPVAPAVLRRRSRSAIYKNIETIVDNMGYNGRDCVLRTLCESRQWFQSSKMNMIGEMLRVVFSLPKQTLFSRELRENPDIVHYDKAYRHGHITDCSQYHCHFSLLELAFGKYSKPPKNYYG